MKYRILHLVASPTLTGAAAPAFGLAKAQMDLGHSVDFGFDQSRPGDMESHVEQAGLGKVKRLALGSKTHPKVMLRDILRLRSLGALYDVVHCHSAHDHSLAMLARMPRLVRSLHHPRTLERRLLRELLVRRTRGFVALHQAHGERLLKCYPELDESQVDVVSGAVDVDRFRPAFSPPQGEFVFGHVSRIKAGRGHSRVIHAFARAFAANSRLRLHLVGKGEGEPEIRRVVAQLGLQDAVRFLGFRDDDLPQVYRSFDCTILPEAGNDASCRAALESMAAGVVVLLGEHLVVPREAVVRGGGELVGSSEEAWAQAMLRASSWAPSEHLERRQRARRLMLEENSEAVRAKSVLAAYGRWQLKRSPPRRLKHRFRAHLFNNLAETLGRAPALGPQAPSDVRRVLVVRIDERVGNVLLTGPLIRSTQDSFPNAKVEVLVAPHLRDLLPSGVEALGYRRRDLYVRPWRYFDRLFRVRSTDYDIAIDASHWHRFSGTSAFLLGWSGASVRVAHDRGPAPLFANALARRPNTVEPEVSTKLRLMEPLGIEASTVFETPLGTDEASASFARQHAPAERLFVVVPGSRKTDHRASLALFEGLIAMAENGGLTPWILWGPQERALATELGERSHALVAPPSSLAQLAAVFRRASVVVSNDTGPMHLSVACGARTLSLFTASDPRRWGHPVPHHRTVVVRGDERDILQRCRKKLDGWLG